MYANYSLMVYKRLYLMYMYVYVCMYVYIRQVNNVKMLTIDKLGYSCGFYVSFQIKSYL